MHLDLKKVIPHIKLVSKTIYIYCYPLMAIEYTRNFMKRSVQSPDIFRYKIKNDTKRKIFGMMNTEKVVT
jgi:hypothetical protein